MAGLALSVVWLRFCFAEWKCLVLVILLLTTILRWDSVAAWVNCVFTVFSCLYAPRTLSVLYKTKS